MGINMLLQVIAVAIVVTIIKQNHVTEAQTLDHRLPNDIIPENYVITLIPFYPDFFQLLGTVKISVRPTRATNIVTLHAHYLQIDETSVFVRDVETNVNITITEYGNITDSRHFYTLELEKNLEVGKPYEIYMEYIGELKDDMYGFYRSSYTVGNEVRWLAVTQFESTSARRAFPCFDEPHFKATFEISIGHYTNLTAVSNTPIANTTEPVAELNGGVWDHFEKTVPMSTYLVAFLVSDFKSITNDHGNFSILAREEVVQYGSYSQIIGPASLKLLEEYTGILYKLPKVDQVALPDFAAGAMENWGLVTYRETGLLYNDQTSTASNKASIAMVIAHELTHQWFGNLVTLHWWSYTWLNEGFARLFQYYIINSVETTWRIMDQFVVAQLQTVFSTDALISSQSLNSDCMTPGEISAKFSTISYSKGACILRMINHTITGDTFQKGIQKYLSEREFNTAEPVHLYSALQHHAQEDNNLESTAGTIESLFGKWASQPGYPVITVTRNYQQNTTQITQERFLLLQPSEKPTERWSIPLSWTAQNNAPTGFATTSPYYWFKDTDTSITINNIASADEWVIFNNQETGYYRVNYDSENWNKIISYLQSDDFSKIHTLNRAQLIDDSLNLARAGLLSYDTALEITQYLVRETDYIPWSSAFTGISFINRLLIASEAYEEFKVFILELLQSSYESTGFQEEADDPQLTKLHRSNVLNWACTLGHSECITQAREEFYKWAIVQNPDTNNPISPNLRSIVYCTAVANGGETEWNFLWQRYTNAAMASEKSLILSALGCSKSEATLNTYLQKSITDNSGIRKQDASSVFSAVYSNTDGIDIALNFLISNFQSISVYYGGMGAISNSLTGIANRLTTQTQIDLLNKFVTDNEGNLDSAASAAKTAVETARGNLDWKNKNYKVIENWLLIRTQSTTPDGSSTTPGGSNSHHGIHIFVLIAALLATYFLNNIFS